MTLNPPVEGEREVVIYDPIYVVPAILVFPWIPVSGEYYRYQLKVNEGEPVNCKRTGTLTQYNNPYNRMKPC